jgi:hypothetical protein
VSQSGTIAVPSGSGPHSIGRIGLSCVSRLHECRHLTQIRKVIGYPVM